MRFSAERSGRRWQSSFAVGLALFLFTCRPAFAHTAFKSMGGFWSGVLHLLTSIDQISLLLAIGIWTSLQKHPRPALTLGGVFLGILLGTFMPAAGLRWAEASLALPIFMVLVGLAAALGLQLSNGLLAAIALSCGVCLGIESADGTAQISIPLFALGGAIAGASVLSYVCVAAARLHYSWSKIALRACASWIAAIGAMMAAFGFRALSSS